MARDYKAMRKWLKESNAEMLEFSVASFTDSEEILRGFPTSKIPKEKIELCKEFLTKVGSVNNTAENNFIKNPLINEEVWPGKYQHFFAGLQVWKREEYLTQLIRKGFYQDISYRNSEVSGERTVQTRQQKGLTTETPEPLVGVAGQVKDQRITLDPKDGSRDIVTNRDIGTVQTTTTKIVSPAREVTITEKTVQSSALADPESAKGYIKRVINRVSRYFSRYETFEESEKPTDQESTSYDVSKSGTITKVSHTENDTALVEPTATKGTINRQDSRPTEAGNEATVEEEEIPEDQESTGYSDNGLSSSKRVHHTENDTDPDAPVSEQGERINLLVRRTKSGQLETDEDTETSKHETIDEFVSRYGERGTEYLSGEIHDHNAPDIEDETADGIDTSVLSHSLDDFLTHNFNVRRIDRKFPISDEDNVNGISWPIYGAMESISIQSDQSKESGSTYVSDIYLYQTVYNYTLRYFSSASAASTWLKTESFGSLSVLPTDPNANGFSSGLNTKYDENGGSRVFHTGEFEWEALLVATTHSERYHYKYDDPSV